MSANDARSRTTRLWARGRSGRVLLMLTVLAWSCQQATPAGRVPDPEDGAMTPHGYANPYFGLAYPFTPGWKASLAGPLPSADGYYVLGSIDTADGRSANLLMAAQDMFFSPQPFDDVLALVKATRQTMAALPGMQIDREPLAVTVAGHAFGRIDYSGVGLYRSMLATEIRCHIVSFVATANDPALLEQAVLSLDRLSLPSRAGDGAIPLCIKDYAAGENLLRRIEPRPAPPYYTHVAVRIIVGADGKITHIHVIRASDEQRKNIAEALKQWRLRPLQRNGKAVAIETGLRFEFRPASR